MRCPRAVTRSSLLAAIATAAGLASLSAPAWSAAPSEPGATFRDAADETIEAAVARLRPNQLLVVEVSASWCGPCHELHDQVLATEAARELLGPDLGLTVDFDSDYGQLAKKKYGVINLPTTFVLDAEGVEIGRVEGFSTKADYLESMRDVKARRVGLPALEQAAKRAPKDLEAQVRWAQARLVRGDEARAMALLDEVVARSDEPGALEASAHAARVKGRWLLRVNEDGAGALAHFSAMSKRFAGTRHEGAMVYWEATSWHALGDDGRALGLLDAWVDRAASRDDALAARADFVSHFHVDLGQAGHEVGGP